MLRATWRGLETWHGRDASANWRASPRPYREGPFFVPSPAIGFPERGRGQGTEMLAKLGGLPPKRRLCFAAPPAFAGAGFDA